ncbi:MAG: guanylate kinase [Longimicrobiaceae bacterium]
MIPSTTGYGEAEGAAFPLILAAPSGAGKTTIARKLRERRSDVAFSLSVTTRPPRPGEREGVDYTFVSPSEFLELVERGELLEWAEVHGQLYGTPRRELEEARAQGEHLLLDIDVQGARQLRTAVPDAVAVFILPPSGSVLVDRLLGRGSEGRDSRLHRLERACAELEAAAEFDQVVVNDDLERAVDDVEAILDGRPGRARPAGLKGEVSRLRAEIRRLAEQS